MDLPISVPAAMALAAVPVVVAVGVVLPIYLRRRRDPDFSPNVLNGKPLRTRRAVSRALMLGEVPESPDDLDLASRLANSWRQRPWEQALALAAGTLAGAGAGAFATFSWLRGGRPTALIGMVKAGATSAPA
ncbi:MAG TPA: hypothetical protein VG709_08520 [Actinomycetota bacterium]|nr:hypothetical protein [Actinomycetota bacterium]